ncbi:PrsW family intramembrane metalloprotease [Salinigranum salinum]|uniref:PrsW family intramembrane metalloprotease n=1 Tax=Salinigranum salinum TaxID=1364937 RepID=UPI0012605049|nr:PrsW family intramembrane metalloprotease [Salinigranum salinum]
MSEQSEEPPDEPSTEPPVETYGVTTWEPRSPIDRASVSLYETLATRWRLVVVALAALVLLGQFFVAFGLFATDPFLAVFSAVSVVPALLLFWYIRRQDVDPEPVGTLAVTFVLGGLLASFAALVNTAAGTVFQQIPLVGSILLFFLIVGPGEELVKWLAVRLYAYERPEFDAVVDGAMYGAAAGLGFASIENVIYIGQNALTAIQNGGPVLAATIPTTVARSLAGPGHVLYSAFAGYYLGLARFNDEHYGPLVVKGLLVAAVLHATYNSLTTLLPQLLPTTALTTFAFILVWDGALTVVLVRKLRRYRRVVADRPDGEADTGGSGAASADD